MFSKSPGMFHPASVSFPGHGAAVSSEVREPTGPEPSSGSNDMWIRQLNRTSYEYKTYLNVYNIYVYTYYIYIYT